jgi:hypothetical protein
MSSPIGISDEASATVLRLARPLTPAARNSFLETLFVELKDLPQPLGDGEVHRAARALVRSGLYHLDPSMVLPDDVKRYGAHSGGYKPRIHHPRGRTS